MMLRSRASQTGGAVRWTVCGLLLVATTLNYVDRQIIGLLAPRLQHDVGWDERGYAHVVTAFQVAYALGLMLSGRLIDRIGAKRGYAFAVLLWSLACMAHSFARSVFGFGVARFALGLGEAGNFPAAIKVVAEWFPKKERSLATGIFNSGANVGAILGPIVVPFLTVYFGWPAAFVCLGIVGFAWVAVWLAFYDSVDTSSRLGARELAHIRDGGADPPVEHIRWLSLFRYRQTWAYAVQSLIISPVWWFYLFWLPKFLNTRYGLDIKNVGLPLVAVYSAAGFGSIAGGWLSSYFLRKGWSVNAARKTALFICACCTVPVAFAGRVDSVWVSAGFFALAASAHQGWAANAYTTVSDLFPTRAIATVVGLGGMFGSVAAIGFSEWAGYLLQRTGRYDQVLTVCAGAYLFALLCFHLLAPRMHPVEIESARA